MLAAEAGEGRDALAEAVNFLEQALRDGERPSKDVEAEAKTQSISRPTLKRARWELGVGARKEGFGVKGKWLWSLRGSSKTETEASAKGIKEASVRIYEPEAKSAETLRGSTPTSTFGPLSSSDLLSNGAKGIKGERVGLDPLSKEGQNLAVAVAGHWSSQGACVSAAPVKRRWPRDDSPRRPRMRPPRPSTQNEICVGVSEGSPSPFHGVTLWRVAPHGPQPRQDNAVHLRTPSPGNAGAGLAVWRLEG